MAEEEAQRRRDGASARFDAAKSEASEAVVHLVTRMTAWRERRDAVLSDIEALVAEYREVQGAISFVARRLLGFAWETDDTRNDVPDVTAPPPELASDGVTLFADAWREAGGEDPQLKAWPDRVEARSLLAELRTLVTQRSGMAAYTARARFFLR